MTERLPELWVKGCEHGQQLPHATHSDDHEVGVCNGMRLVEAEVVETFGSMELGPVLTVDDYGTYLVCVWDKEIADLSVYPKEAEK